MMFSFPLTDPSAPVYAPMSMPMSSARPAPVIITQPVLKKDPQASRVTVQTGTDGAGPKNARSAMRSGTVTVCQAAHNYIRRQTTRRR